MKSINALLLVSLIATPALPMIKIGDTNDMTIIIGTDTRNVNTEGLWGFKMRNCQGLGFINGKWNCVGDCNGQIEYWEQAGKTVIDCLNGKCTETRYNALGRQISPELPSNTAQIAQKGLISGFFSNNPILAPLLVGASALAAGYGLYRLSKAVQKPKNSKKQ